MLMLTDEAFGDSPPHRPVDPGPRPAEYRPPFPRLLFWQRVRACAVPPRMIETATRRRAAGDWAGACAAAEVDVSFAFRAVRHRWGEALASRLRSDLQSLAPDLLRWHFPRTGPDGLLRAGTAVTLARYGTGTGRPVHLLAETPPASVQAGQRLTLWLGDRPGPDCPSPDRRFRLDLHRHLWDAGRSGELRERADLRASGQPPPWHALLGSDAYASGRWGAEAALLLRAEGRGEAGHVLVRLARARRLLLHVRDGAVATAEEVRARAWPGVPTLPEAAVWVPPDVELLRAGLLAPDALHPLVAAALAPGAPGPVRQPPGPEVLRIACQGASHRLGRTRAGGPLVALDHTQEELEREELLAQLGGTPLPCLGALREAARELDVHPEVRELLRYGDVVGATERVTHLVGPQRDLPEGELRTALAEAGRQRLRHDLHRAGLSPAQRIPLPPAPRRRPIR
ncbi:hypothetical protein [Streptomyces sp. NPDC088923]|uniref:hypothetical protein n=1 Tax=Streptomyces sp. NPDC088923 TaxID=3365913 RepID=UPI003826CB69